ncbi:hypothetical protein BVE84_03625, partial [Streptococcus azizii]
MENHKRRKFDWYGLSQRFSIRTYHFGAASVLLGTAMTLLLTPAPAAANEVATNAGVLTAEVVNTEEGKSTDSGTATSTSERVVAEEHTATTTSPSTTDLGADKERVSETSPASTEVEKVTAENETPAATGQTDKEKALEEHRAKVINHIKALQYITEEEREEFLKQVEAATVFGEIAEVQSKANVADVRGRRNSTAPTTTTASTAFRAMGESDTSKTKNYTFQDAMTVFPDLSKAGGNTIDFQIAYYLAGANSGNNWKFRLQLDEAIASKVTTITVKPVGGSNDVTLTRVGDTNIFESNFIRANGGIFGGAELGTQTTTGRITLSEPIQSIVGNPDTPEFMAYRTYVFDSGENAVIATSATSGVFRVRENQTPSPISTDTAKLNSLQKITTSASVKYIPDYGQYGAIVFDQVMLKNGTLALALQSALKNTTYNVDIDPALLEYIDTAELHIAEYSFIAGLDEKVKSDNYRARTTFDQNGRASFTIGNDAVSLGNSTNKKSYVNVNGAQNPAYVRTVLTFKKPVNNLMTGSEEGYPVFKVPAESDILPITGYFTSGSGVLPTTLGNSGLLATDVGIPDKDIYDPETEVINKPFGEATTNDDLTKAVKKIPAASRVTPKAGATVPDGNTAGTFEVPVVVTYPDGSSEEVTVTVIVAEPTAKPSIGAIENKTVNEKQPIEAIDVPVENKPANGTVEVNGLPGGLTYDPATGKVTGTPTVTDWTNTEESREFTVTVVVKDSAGTPVAEKDFIITVQRDTDGDRDPDVTDPDDDNDGFTDEEEKTAGTDPKDPNSKPTGLSVTTSPATVSEKTPVPENTKVVTPNKDGSAITSTPTNGLSVDENGNLTGTPTVTDWGKE